MQKYVDNDVFKYCVFIASAIQFYLMQIYVVLILLRKNVMKDKCAQRKSADMNLRAWKLRDSLSVLYSLVMGARAHERSVSYTEPEPSE